MEQMVAKGYHTRGYAAFGYVTQPVPGAMGAPGKPPPKQLVPDPSAEGIVAAAYALYLRTETIARVAEHLNAVTARRWTAETTKNLLTNEVYARVQNFGQWRNEAAHLPLVERETWNAVQAAIAAKNPAASGTKRVVDDYIFYLKGRVFCPHCGCGCTQSSHHGRSGRVQYYVCLRANRREEGCPVGAVNADKLHRCVIALLRRGAKHQTALHKLIAQSGGWQGAAETLMQTKGALAKKKQFLEVREASYVKAIGEGRALDALLPALEAVRRDMAQVAVEMASAERAIAEATVVRPTAQEVQSAWRRLLEAWEGMDGAGKLRLMEMLVSRVEVWEKKKPRLRLWQSRRGFSVVRTLVSLTGSG